jgi:tRNA pseudouridine38-40 synthase
VKLAFTVEYDGTDFSGFQRQKNAITIQEHLENAIMEITGNPISINYSGRTDAGVHALSQVFDFETNLKREDNNWIKGINSNLPNTISVKEIYHVPDSFNSRFSAINRNYSYVIYNSSSKQLFFDKYSHRVSNSLDIEEMSRQIKMFIGEHDFSSFRSSSCNSMNPIKKVLKAEVKTFNKFIIISISANAFLQNMVRIMVGTILDISKNENNLSVSEIIKKKDRSCAGKTLPASGLFFLGPSYDSKLKIQSPVKNLLERFKI